MSGAAPLRGSQNLNHADYDVLLRRLDPDPRRSAEKYEQLRQRLVKFFEWNNCWSEAQDLAGVTIDIVAKKPGDFVIDNVPAYCHRVASRLVIRFKRRRARVVALGDIPELQGSGQDDGGERSVLEDIDHQEHMDSLKQCLKRLKSADRNLVLEYYSSRESTHITHRQELAKILGISMNNLRVRAQRIRNGLEECLKGRLERHRNISKRELRRGV